MKMHYGNIKYPISYAPGISRNFKCSGIITYSSFCLERLIKSNGQNNFVNKNMQENPALGLNRKKLD